MNKIELEYRYKKERLENKINIIGVVVLVILLLILVGKNISIQKENNLLKEQLKENNTLTYSLDILSNNCGDEYSGSILITKGNPNPNIGKGYYIFKNECKIDGYCKYDYIPIEECLK